MSNSPSSRLRLVLSSAKYFWKAHLAVAVGVAAAVAVIVGALVVGDSVRGSLRSIVGKRLANIDCILHSRVFFSIDSLPAAEANNDGQADSGNLNESHIAPAMVFPNSSIELTQGVNSNEERFANATGVTVYGVGSDFWDNLNAANASLVSKTLGDDELVINAALATELGVSVGDVVTIRMGSLAGVAGDNPLSKRDESIVSLPRQTIVGVIANDSVGGFSLVSTQSVSKNVFASLATLQDLLEREGQANGAFVLNNASAEVSPEAATRSRRLADSLNMLFRPKLEDYGLTLEHHRRVFPDPKIDRGIEKDSEIVVYDYHQLVSEELIIEESIAEAVTKEFEEDEVSQRLITYLANTITKIEPTNRDFERSNELWLAARSRDSGGDGRTASEYTLVINSLSSADQATRERESLSRKVPYSIVVGSSVSSEPNLLEYLQVDRRRVERPFCFINSWLAGQLEAAAGDWITVSYFEPETADGSRVTRSFNAFIAGIVPVTEPAKRFSLRRPAQFAEQPTIFNDPGLTPHVPGITDQASISNWDLPFELELKDLIKSQDDDYWNNHRLTPKVFLDYEFASSRNQFGSRFGKTTAIRFKTALPENGDSEADGNRIDPDLRKRIESALLKTRDQKGLSFIAIREQQTAAASGTTPFDMLFLSLSMFVILSAVILVSLLFKLGLQQRLSQLGVLFSQGFQTQTIRQLLTAEYGLVALVGAIVGVPLGLGYAYAMIAGLSSWWAGAVSGAHLAFDYSVTSLLIGALVGVVICLATVYLALRRATKASPLSMLRGMQEALDGQQRMSTLSIMIAIVSIVSAAVLALTASSESGMVRAGYFFGAGVLLLAGFWIVLRQILVIQSLKGPSKPSTGVFELAFRGICRNPSRSALSLGLFAVASFLIASMSIFQVRVSESGYGGFNLIGQTSQPIYESLASQRNLEELLGETDARTLRSSVIVPMRLRGGDDASCNNLFQVAQPAVVGVPRRLSDVFEFAVEHPRFEWAATEAPESPWKALEDRRATGAMDAPIPVILDQNTAAWSLKQGAALDSIIRINYDNRDVYFKTVGLLSNSVLQGKLMISERSFKRLFPKLSGFRFFMVRTEKNSVPTVSSLLERDLSDYGMDVTRSEETLKKLLGVQNTYIRAFQSLGALGLLLGTFGLIAAQLRSVNERRSELALMQAIGFSRASIGRLLLFETLLLLAGGVFAGIAASMAAIVPYILDVGPQLTLMSPLLMLLVVLTAGIVASGAAVFSALRHPLLPSLRAE